MDAREVYRQLTGQEPTANDLAAFIQAYNVVAADWGWPAATETDFPDQAWQELQDSTVRNAFVDALEGGETGGAEAGGLTSEEIDAAVATLPAAAQTKVYEAIVQLGRAPTAAELQTIVQQAQGGASRTALYAAYQNYLRETGQWPPKSSEPSERTAYTRFAAEVFDEWHDELLSSGQPITLEEFNVMLREEKLDLDEDRVVRDLHERELYEEDFNKAWGRLTEQVPALAALDSQQRKDLQQALAVQYAQTRFTDPLGQSDTLYRQSMARARQAEDITPEFLAQLDATDIPASAFIMTAIQNGTAGLILTQAALGREDFDDAFARLAPSLRQGMTDTELLELRTRLRQQYGEQLAIGNTGLAPAQYVTANFARTAGQMREEAALATRQAGEEGAAEQFATTLATLQRRGEFGRAATLVGMPPTPPVTGTPEEQQAELARAQAELARLRGPLEEEGAMAQAEVGPEELRGAERRAQLAQHNIALGQLARGTTGRGTRVVTPEMQDFEAFQRQRQQQPSDFSAFLEKQFPTAESTPFRELRTSFAEQPTPGMGFDEFLQKRLSEGEEAFRMPPERREQEEREFRTRAFRTTVRAPGR